MTPMPLVAVERVESNDGVIRVERLACGHTTSLMSYERNAKSRRCARCAIEDDEEVPE